MRLLIFKHGKEISKVGTKIGSGHRDKNNMSLISSNGRSNQAVAGEDHIVARGSNDGRDIVRMVISNPNKDSTIMNSVFTTYDILIEHHCDPPLLNIECPNSSILVIKEGNTSIENSEAHVARDDGCVCMNRFDSLLFLIIFYDYY